MKNRTGPIRVMVVEDSPTARDLLVALFSHTSDLQVVGTALDGEEAIRLAARIRPDVITMDIHMPHMDGLEATRKIMKTMPLPIVIVTASLNRSDMDLTFQAMRVGALMMVKKPSLADEASCQQVVQTVRLMADVPVVRRFGKTKSLPPLSASGLPDRLPAHLTPPNVSGVTPPVLTGQTGRAIIGIASSTGGPSALVTALKPLPASYPLPILVVQHITQGFAICLCDWLNSELNLKAHLAQHGELPEPGHVLIAPDDGHMEIGEQGQVILQHNPPLRGQRPSANYLFSSLARVYGRRATGIILTGMGEDGVDGLVELHHRGGLTIAQDEATSVVFGMPREAINRNAVDYVIAIEKMGPALMHLPMLPVPDNQRM